MAFQLDSNVYSKQKSLSDYMAVNEARDLQRAQAEQSMAASDMTMKAAKQKQEMEAVGMGLAGATEADYPARRQALLKQGVPEQFLPEQYNPALIDAIMTKTGYKSKPSLAEQLMQPLSMMMGARPLSEMVATTPESTQNAAPIQTGSITTQPVGNIDQYAVDSGVMPPANNASLDDIVSQARAMEAGQTPTPAPNQQMMPPTLPAQIPDTNLSTPIPAYQPKTLGAAYEADKAAAKASAEAMVPMSAKERAEIAIKQAPIQAAKESKMRAQTGFDSIMDDMNKVYDDLSAENAAPSETKTWDENLGIWITKTNPVAQYIGEKTGTKAQSIIQRLDPLKTRAKEQIMMATGMSSKAIDSNAEMKSFLDSLTNVNNTREANAFTIQTMQRLYGTPEKAAARDAAIKSGQIQPITDFSGQGGSNATTSGSSGGGAVDPRIAKAKAAGYTDEEIQQYLGSRK